MAQTYRRVDRRATLPVSEFRQLTAFSNSAQTIVEQAARFAGYLDQSIYWKHYADNYRLLTERIGMELALINSRLNDFSSYAKGWLDGEGEEIAARAISRAAAIAEQLLNREVPRPRVFPTLEGGVQMEWTHEDDQISVNIRPNNMIYGLRVRVDGDEIVEREYQDMGSEEIPRLILDR